MSLTLKIAWKNDVRRYRVPASGFSYNELAGAVAQMFDLSDFRLKYIDEDQELITISSDRELTEAIEYLREQDPRKIVRFFVRTPDDISTELTQSVAQMNLASTIYSGSTADLSRSNYPYQQTPPYYGQNHQLNPNFHEPHGGPMQFPGPVQDLPRRYDAPQFPPHQPLAPPQQFHPVSPMNPPYGSGGEPMHPVSPMNPPYGSGGVEMSIDSPDPNSFPSSYKHEPIAKPVEVSPKKSDVSVVSPALKSANNFSCKFVADTHPDGTVFKPNEKFTKVWTIKNHGDSVWPKGTVFQWITGDKISAENPRIPVPQVEPGQTCDISLDIVTPSKPGNYASHFRCYLPNGKAFGQRVWVEFVVAE